MRFLWTVGMLFCLAFLHAQSPIFKDGYFIDNSGKRTDCLIEYWHWNENPKKFTYKMTQEGDKIRTDIKKVKEFGVHERATFKRFIVKIDRTVNHVDNLTYNREPIFETDTLFLKVMVQGKANLYSYTETNMFRYFYDLGSDNPEQLVYLRYRTKTEMGHNRRYRQQLFNSLKCGSIPEKKFKHLDYDSKSFKKLFLAYNNCGAPTP